MALQVVDVYDHSVTFRLGERDRYYPRPYLQQWTGPRLTRSADGR